MNEIKGIINTIIFFINEHIFDEELNKFFIVYDKQKDCLSVVPIDPHIKYYEQIQSIYKSVGIIVYSSTEDAIPGAYNYIKYLNDSIEACIDDVIILKDDGDGNNVTIYANDLLNRLKKQFNLTEYTCNKLSEQFEQDDFEDIEIIDEEDDMENCIENTVVYLTRLLSNVQEVKQSFFNMIEQYADDIYKTVKSNLKKLSK
jgi:hypothetical protein